MKHIRDCMARVVLDSDSVPGRIFDVSLIVMILASVAVVMLDSVKSFSIQYGSLLGGLEWFFTILFTVEYFTRIWVAPKASTYVFSFFGVVDLPAILPSYIAVLTLGSNVFLILRMLRLLRIFRILKLVNYSEDAQLILTALRQSRRRITVFFFTVLILVTILGSAMYVIEVEQEGFANIPESIYWAIVTITTVGYGDLYPQTALGQSVSALVMLLGYAIIAVPSSIFAVELYHARSGSRKSEG